MRGGRTFRIRRLLLLSAAAFAALWVWFHLCVWAFWPTYSWGPHGMGLRLHPQDLGLADVLHPLSHPSWALVGAAACILAALASLLADEISLLPSTHASTRALLLLVCGILVWMDTTQAVRGGTYTHGGTPFAHLGYGRPWIAYLEEIRGPDRVTTIHHIEPLSIAADVVAAGLLLALLYAICEWAWTLPCSHALHLERINTWVLAGVAALMLGLNAAFITHSLAGGSGVRAYYNRGWPVAYVVVCDGRLAGGAGAAADLANLAIFLGALAAANVLWNRLRGCTWTVPAEEGRRPRGPTPRPPSGR